MMITRAALAVALSFGLVAAPFAAEAQQAAKVVRIATWEPTWRLVATCKRPSCKGCATSDMSRVAIS
jgi:hypothetical protein